jgi:hypothetical protein
MGIKQSQTLKLGTTLDNGLPSQHKPPENAYTYPLVVAPPVVVIVGFVAVTVTMVAFVNLALAWFVERVRGITC